MEVVSLAYRKPRSGHRQRAVTNILHFLSDGDWRDCDAIWNNALDLGVTGVDSYFALQELLSSGCVEMSSPPAQPAYRLRSGGI